MALRSFIFNFSCHRGICAIFWLAVIGITAEVGCTIFLPRSNSAHYFTEVRERVERLPAPDVEIIGDSVAAGGILPSLLRTGDAIRNDAVPGSAPLYSYLLLRREISAGHIPRVLVISHSPHTFAGINFATLVGGFAHWNELPGLLWYADDKPSFVYGMLLRFSYILAYREQFKELLTHGDTSFFTKSAEPPQTEEERVKAYREQRAAGTFTPKPLVDGLYGIHRTPFIVSPETDHYFTALLALAKAHGIKVYWVTMPVLERVYDHRGPKYDAAMHDYLDRFVDRGELEYLQRDFAVYPDGLFDDLSHLNTAGAIKFTDHLAQIWPSRVKYGAAQP